MPPSRRLSTTCSAIQGLTLVFAFMTVGYPATAAGDGCKSLAHDLHQLENASSRGSLVTPYADEAAGAVSRYGFSDLGIVGSVATGPVPGPIAVSRLQKGSDFVYAVTSEELAQAKSSGYEAMQQVAFYAPRTVADPCLEPVTQMVRDDRHRLAVGDATRSLLEKQGWTASSVTFAVAAAPTAPAPAPSPSSPSGRPVPSGPSADQIRGSDSDRVFSIAVIPDTQQETWTDGDSRLLDRSNWLVSSRKKLDLRYALHVGDVTDWDTSDHAQYARAASGLLPPQAKIPWAAAIGNHDTHAVCAGGSACPGQDASIGVRDTSVFNAYFPRSRFATMQGEFEPGKVDNAYSTFRSGGREWLVLTLELWPRQAVVTWAQKIVADNPKRNVIVLTHSYLDAQGKVSNSNGGYGATSPKYLFDNLVSRYPNVKFVFSGHVGSAAVRTDRGAKKNKVVSMLQCFHDRKNNPVRLVEIDTKKGMVKTWVYEPSSKVTEKEYSKTIDGLSFV